MDKNTMIVAAVGVLLILNPKPGEQPAGTLTVAELVDNPIYGTDVRVYGEVSGMDKCGYKCFFLESGGERMRVNYGSAIVEGRMIGGMENATEKMSVVEEGDYVVLTGSLDTLEKGHGQFYISGINH
jgi:hypothetical protein